MSESYQDAKECWLTRWQNKPEYATRLDFAPQIVFIKKAVDVAGGHIEDVKSFCELGVGTGNSIHYFHEKYPEWEYRGIDINPEVHKLISTTYPGVLDYADIKSIDTLAYLRECNSVDLFYSKDHLMHIPEPVIEEVCALMASKAKKYILIREAYEGHRQGGNRYERDYTDAFPGFVVIHKELQSSFSAECLLALYLFRKEDSASI